MSGVRQLPSLPPTLKWQIYLIDFQQNVKPVNSGIQYRFKLRGARLPVIISNKSQITSTLGSARIFSSYFSCQVEVANTNNNIFTWHLYFLDDGNWDNYHETKNEATSIEHFLKISWGSFPDNYNCYFSPNTSEVNQIF